MVATATIGQEVVRVFLKVRKKSGNFILSQGKVLKKTGKSENFKSTYLFFSLYFCCFLM